MKLWTDNSKRFVLVSFFILLFFLIGVFFVTLNNKPVSIPEVSEVSENQGTNADNNVSDFFKNQSDQEDNNVTSEKLKKNQTKSCQLFGSSVSAGTTIYDTTCSSN